MIVAPRTKEDANELYLIIGELEGKADRVEPGLQFNWLKASERLGYVIQIFAEIAKILRYSI